MRALSQDLCGCTMIKVLWKVSQQVCIWFPTGQGSCVGSSTATVYRTSHLTLNSSHIRLISTGKCHLLSVWIQYELAWHCATHVVADLYSTRPPLWKSNTNMSSWPSQTLESQLISSIQTPTALILPVSFSLLQFVFQTCLFFVLPKFLGFSIKLFWTTLIVKNKTKKKVTHESERLCTSKPTFQLSSIVGSGWWKAVGRRHPGSFQLQEVSQFVSFCFTHLLPNSQASACISGRSSMQRWFRGWERPSTSRQSSTVMEFRMRKWRSSKSYQSLTPLTLLELHWLRFCTTETHFLLRIGVSVKQQFTEEEIYKDRDSQISAIEKTFEDAQKSVRGSLIAKGQDWMQTKLTAGSSSDRTALQ